MHTHVTINLVVFGTFIALFAVFIWGNARWHLTPSLHASRELIRPETIWQRWWNGIYDPFRFQLKGAEWFVAGPILAFTVLCTPAYFAHWLYRLGEAVAQQDYIWKTRQAQRREA